MQVATALDFIQFPDSRNRYVLPTVKAFHSLKFLISKNGPIVVFTLWLYQKVRILHFFCNLFIFIFQNLQLLKWDVIKHATVDAIDAVFVL